MLGYIRSCARFLDTHSIHMVESYCCSLGEVVGWHVNIHWVYFQGETRRMQVGQTQCKMM